MRSAARLALCLLVLLAGCNAPLRTPATETPSSLDEPSTGGDGPGDAGDPLRPLPGTPESATVGVSGGDLPVDPGRAYARVRYLLDASTPPPTVDVRARAHDGTGLRPAAGDFEAVVGVGPPRPADESDLEVGGATTPDGTVFVVPGEARADRVERTLAHEFVHVVQFDRGVVSALTDRLPRDRRSTSDGQFALRSVVEGAATYVATRYTRRYLPSVETERETLARIYANASAGTRLFWSAYYYGDRYVAASVDGARALESVYADPPTTTEQVLHRDGDRPVPLSVDAAHGETDWFETGSDSRGELFVRVLLRSELPRERAVAAAAGWGNDRLLTFSAPEGRGFAWVLRWDDADEATAARRAFADYLDAFATATGTDWRRGTDAFALSRVDDRTVALLAGDPGFVDGTSVSPGDGRVIVRPSAPSAV